MQHAATFAAAVLDDAAMVKATSAKQNIVLTISKYLTQNMIAQAQAHAYIYA